MIAIITLGLTASAMHSSPVLGRLVSSAQSFHYYFRDLKKAGTSLNPIERFVFSLVLANPNVPQTPGQCAAPERRT